MGAHNSGCYKLLSNHESLCHSKIAPIFILVSVTFIHAILNRELKEQRRQRQRNRHLKIDDLEW